MTVFSVWAPQAREVALVIEDTPHEMRPDSSMNQPNGGWWRASVHAAGAGTDYRFSLDGGPALPDPRSPYQPEGVHGPSRVVDHTAFDWTDHEWRGPTPLASGLIYELHIGTFTPEGTFASAALRLPHLAALGVTHVELLPVVEFPGTRGWGYDGVDLYAPHHAYGGPVGFKRFVDACHAQGLGVILDVVYNHLGPDGNYLGAYGPYFTDKYATPWGQAVNFDGPDSDEVRNFVCDNACMWLRDYHVDGLRLDAVHAILDTSSLHLLEELATRVEELSTIIGRHVFVTAESDLNDPRLVRSKEVGGDGLDAVWNDDFHHAVHAVLTGEQTGYYEDFGSLAHLSACFERAFAYDGRYSPHRRRRHGRPITGLPGTRFISFVQNHDQIGNRAQGERLAALVSPGRLQIAAALLLTAPFIPLLFEGEEWAASSPFLYFSDHQDPELGRAVSEGRRREFAAFGWDPESVPDPQDPATFERSKLDWAELDKEPHASVLAWYRQLIDFRRETPALTDGRFDRIRTTFDEAAGWIVVERGPVTVVANISDARQFPPAPPGSSMVVLASAPYTRLTGDGRIDMPPESVAIVT